ncbi:MAG: thioredoxin family protein [Deltaproteobacteria bacterium]|nr:thioredoxin family protein [Deltaproteobacteria bacterium]
MDIKILGPGCASCDRAEKLVREVVHEGDVDAVVEKVTGIRQIAQYGVFTTPAVVVDGDVKCVGKVPDKEEIKLWIDKS